ncbi:hypothetical protein GNZ25_14140 [Burkholderia thailandensis]|uniref:hypothetical protein n=1 Tax=Burkholderia thailandensis TaxID=57975 RepID=UPI0012E75BFA|nr:hypothetical protein [Burkholderia thailandensis]MUV22477.1 hypothetical protein [Burkholderia thailandensis]
MVSAERTTITLYPIWMVWAGRAVVYLALLILPAWASMWIGQQAPIAIRSAAAIAANVVLLPLFYACAYMLLRKTGARSQKFIYLVIAFFTFFAFTQARLALQTGQIERWVGMALGALYVVGFSYLAYRGMQATRRERRAAYEAEREEQISIQAEAILRAKTLEGGRGT